MIGSTRILESFDACYNSPGTLTTREHFLSCLVANLSCRYNYLSERRICASRVHSLKPCRAAASAASIQGSVPMKVQTAATTATRTPVADQQTGARFCSLQLSAQGRTVKYPEPASVHRKQ